MKHNFRIGIIRNRTRQLKYLQVSTRSKVPESGGRVEHRYIHWDKERSVLVEELNITHTLGQGAFGSGGGVEHRYIHWDKERSVLVEELNIDTYIGTRSVRFWWRS